MYAFPSFILKNAGAKRKYRGENINVQKKCRVYWNPAVRDAGFSGFEVKKTAPKGGV